MQSLQEPVLQSLQETSQTRFAAYKTRTIRKGHCTPPIFIVAKRNI